MNSNNNVPYRASSVTLAAKVGAALQSLLELAGGIAGQLALGGRQVHHQPVPPTAAGRGIGVIGGDGIFGATDRIQHVTVALAVYTFLKGLDMEA